MFSRRRMRLYNVSNDHIFLTGIVLTIYASNGKSSELVLETTKPDFTRWIGTCHFKDMLSKLQHVQSMSRAKLCSCEGKPIAR